MVINAFQIGEFKRKTFFEPVRIQIKESDFNKAVKPAINLLSLIFDQCVFLSEVSITTEGSLSEDFKVLFSGCYIDSFESLIDTQFIHLIISNSYAQHFVCRSINIKITLQNSLGVYFIENSKDLMISYDFSGIPVYNWQVILKQCDYNVLSRNNAFYLDSITNLYYYVNILRTQPTKPRIKIDHKNWIENYKVKYIPSIDDINSLGIKLQLGFKNHKKHTQTKINGAILKSFSLTGVLTNNLSIENMIVEQIYIRAFHSMGNFEFMNVEAPKDSTNRKFEINHSLMGSTWFYGIRFDTFTNIALYKSSFSESRMTSCVFPTYLKLTKQVQALQNIHQDEKSRIFFREQYDLFLELEQLFKKSGNKYEAQKMKAVAYNSLEKVKGLNIFNEWLLLLLNDLSNSHGTAPWRAAIWFLIFLFILFGCCLLSYENIYINLENENSWEIINENFKYIFVLANPVHRISELAPASEITSMTYLISFISRIILGYFYYQFITAFRRFG